MSPIYWPLPGTSSSIHWLSFCAATAKITPVNLKLTLISEGLYTFHLVNNHRLKSIWYQNLFLILIKYGFGKTCWFLCVFCFVFLVCAPLGKLFITSFLEAQQEVSKENKENPLFDSFSNPDLVIYSYFSTSVTSPAYALWGNSIPVPLLQSPVPLTTTPECIHGSNVFTALPIRQPERLNTEGRPRENGSHVSGTAHCWRALF